MRRSSCLLLAGTALFSGVAVAQDKPSATETPVAELAADAAPKKAPVPASDIVVTGSRIQRAGFQAPTPVTVVSADELARSAPSSIPDALNKLPVFQASLNQNSSDIAQSNRVRSGNYLNLRALGTSRVLVLMDGHRLTPTGNNGGTDTNLVPNLLVQRVDIVTGGASAAYGSDAVSGVVNFVLDKKFTGLKFNAQAGVASRGDNESYRVGAAYGGSLLDDRLHILASAERYHSAGISPRTARPGVSKYYNFGGDGSASNPYIFYPNVHYNTAAKGGNIIAGTGVPASLVNKQFLPDGTLVPFNPGISIGRGTAVGSVSRDGEGGDFGAEFTTLTPALTTNQFYGRLSYDISDNISFYVDGTYNRANSRDKNLVYINVGGFPVYRDNAFLPDAVRAQLPASTRNFTLSRMFAEWGGLDSRQRMTAINISTGLFGKIGDWDWDATYFHGDSKFHNAIGEPQNNRFAAATDAVRNSAGNIVCRVTITNPGLMDDCVPLNAFGAGSPSQAARDYVIEQSIWAVRNKMDIGAVNLSGNLFNTWAGPVAVALGAEYRHQSLLQTTNSNPAVPFGTTFLQGGFQPFTPGRRFFLTNVGTGDGAYTIKEAYVEATVPLLKDSALGKSLELNGAFRVTDYSTSGTVKTWKAGVTYEPVSDIRFRGTLSRDIRAPSLFELFGGLTTTTSGGLTDPDHPSQPTRPQLTGGGNPDLKPEVADTLTAGIVLQPSFIPGLSASFDYYDIKLKGAIAAGFQPQDVLNICSRSGRTDPVCSQITRDPVTDLVIAVSNAVQNVQKIETSGLDTEVAYRTRIGGGAIQFRLIATRLFTFDRQSLPGQAPTKFVGTADWPGFNVGPGFPLPKWRGSLSVDYTNGPVSVGVRERMIGSYDKSHLFVYVDNKMPTVFYTDLSASYKLPVLGGSSELFLNVDNLFDKKPPFWPQSSTPGLQPPTVRTTYDIVGTYFTAGIRARF